LTIKVDSTLLLV